LEFFPSHYPHAAQRMSNLITDTKVTAFDPKAVLRPDQPNVRFAPLAAIRKMDILQCEGCRFRPAIGQ
jgi:hypothetical protein